MDSEKQSLFQVYLRLRPPHHGTQAKSTQEPWLLIEPPVESTEDAQIVSPTHITLQPPNDSRKRAVERFGFTKVFEEEASQLELFEGTGTVGIVSSVLKHGRDGLVATLGVTGSGKSHTIFGSRTQRGVTQMSLDMIFKSIGSKIRQVDHPELPIDNKLLSNLQASDSSEATLSSATTFLESIYGETERGRASRAQTPMAGGFSRAQTPMTVRESVHCLHEAFPLSSPSLDGRPSRSIIFPDLAPIANSRGPDGKTVTPTVRLIPSSPSLKKPDPVLPSKLPFWNRSSFVHQKYDTKSLRVKETHISSTNRRPPLPQPSTFPQVPEVVQHAVELDDGTDYAVIVSMYEVYNDRIFDLLSLSMTPGGPQASTRQGTQLQKDLRRRPLLFKSTETSPDRKVVAGLRKVVCGSCEEAMMVLETGLNERRVAGTGSNSASSRSHGFFCVEVKKKVAPRKHNGASWIGGTLSIVDLAGSERARSAKTTGSTLAEAGKINESLMFLGQCLQLQSVATEKPSIVPYRQCKLTELLFSNSFPTTSHSSYRPQKGTMIVTADPHGDFNATSQILRYSALAREVTVPRIPSVTSQILSSSTFNRPNSSASDRTSPNPEALELAIAEIARLSLENDTLAIRLAEEEIKMTEAAISLQAAEEKVLAIEADVREECWAEMETRIEEEKARYRVAWEQEKLMGEEFLDGKIDILERGGIAIAEDATATIPAGSEELERENETLCAKVAALEREIQSRSPTKRSKHSSISRPLGKKENVNPSSTTLFHDTSVMTPAGASPIKTRSNKSTHSDENTLDLRVDELRLEDIHDAVTTAAVEAQAGASTTMEKTPATAKKQRKLTTRKWDLGDENEIFG